jgi:hypothetical protein
MATIGFVDEPPTVLAAVRSTVAQRDLPKRVPELLGEVWAFLLRTDICDRIVISQMGSAWSTLSTTDVGAPTGVVTIPRSLPTTRSSRSIAPPSITPCTTRPRRRSSIPSAGDPAGPVRLAANDPPACTGAVSPGLNNVWPRWAPGATVGPDGKKYCWLSFSSTRSGKTQVYVAGVVRDASGGIATYPAIYAFGQESTLDNPLPAWDDLSTGP